MAAWAACETDRLSGKMRLTRLPLAPLRERTVQSYAYCVRKLALWPLSPSPGQVKPPPFLAQRHHVGNAHRAPDLDRIGVALWRPFPLPLSSMSHSVLRSSIATLVLMSLVACGSASAPSAGLVDACRRAIDRDTAAGRVLPPDPAAFCTCFSSRVDASADVTAAGKPLASQFFGAEGAQPALSEQDFGVMQKIALECAAPAR